MVCDMHYSRDGQQPDKSATVLHGPHPLKLFLMGAESASGPRLGQLAHGLFQHPPGFGAETRFPVLIEARIAQLGPEGLGSRFVEFQPFRCQIRLDRIVELPDRSEERRVGKECVSTWRSRRSP